MTTHLQKGTIMIADLFRKIDKKQEEIMEDNDTPLPKILPKAFAWGAFQGLLEGFTILGFLTSVVLTVTAIAALFQKKQ